jgi:hydroxymethylpyrimidine/phosphomethylpyrimidine kinase
MTKSDPLIVTLPESIWPATLVRVSYPRSVQKSKRQCLPVALSIAGSDSGGGAGIQADLKTFTALGVHGTTVITCVTAQNPTRLSGVEACSPDIVSQQIEAVFNGFKPVAVKTGMLYSGEIIQAVTKHLRRRQVSLIVDPVMISTSGARLLRAAALKALVVDLFPLAKLLTPNIPEAEALLGRKVQSLDQIRTATQQLHRRFGCALLIKGGHLRGVKLAIDVFFDGNQELLLTSPFIQGVRTHGTGCTYSAAITAYLTRGLSLPEAVKRAKKYVSQAIASSQKVATHDVLNWAGK